MITVWRTYEKATERTGPAQRKLIYETQLAFEWTNTSFMKLTLVFQAFENAALWRTDAI